MSANDVKEVNAVERLRQLRSMARNRYRRYWTNNHEAIVASNYAKYLGRAGTTVTCECGRSVKQCSFRAHLATAVHRSRMAEREQAPP